MSHYSSFTTHGHCCLDEKLDILRKMLGIDSKSHFHLILRSWFLIWIKNRLLRILILDMSQTIPNLEFWLNICNRMFTEPWLGAPNSLYESFLLCHSQWSSVSMQNRIESSKLEFEFDSIPTNIRKSSRSLVDQDNVLRSPTRQIKLVDKIPFPLNY